MTAGNRTAKELQSLVAPTLPDVVQRVSGSSLDTAFMSTIITPKVVLCTDKEDAPGLSGNSPQHC